jgi:hypothetical protein
VKWLLAVLTRVELDIKPFAANLTSRDALTASSNTKLFLAMSPA